MEEWKERRRSVGVDRREEEEDPLADVSRLDGEKRSEGGFDIQSALELV